MIHPRTRLTTNTSTTSSLRCSHAAAPSPPWTVFHWCLTGAHIREWWCTSAHESAEFGAVVQHERAADLDAASHTPSSPSRPQGRGLVREEPVRGLAPGLDESLRLCGAQVEVHRGDPGRVDEEGARDRVRLIDVPAVDAVQNGRDE